MAPLVIHNWAAGGEPVVMIDCLLPTGIIVPLQLDKDSSFADIKSALWEEAQKYPLYTHLGDKNKHMFMCITKTGGKMELVDEHRRLDEVQPFEKFLKIVEKPHNKEEKILNAEISFVIGKGLHEFDSMTQLEVNDFRENMRKHCEKIAAARDAKNEHKIFTSPTPSTITSMDSDDKENDKDLLSWQERVQYLYGTDIDDSTEFPDYVQKHLPKSPTLTMCVIREQGPDQQPSLDTAIGKDAKYKFDVLCTHKPSYLVELTLQKIFSKREKADDYVLKVSGRQEYLVVEVPLRQYKFVHKCLATDTIPTVVIKRKADVLDLGPPKRPPRGPPRAPKPSRPPVAARPTHRRKSAPGMCLWDIKDTFSFKIDTVSRVFNSQCTYQLRCCIYHGPQPICEVINSDTYTPQDGLISINETMSFKDLELVNIPRMARLCFMLSAILDKNTKKLSTLPVGHKTKIGNQEFVRMAWVNIPLFDYKGILRSGKSTLYMWDITSDDEGFSEEYLNPIGTVESNPLVKSSMCLTLTFDTFNVQGPVYFPTFDKIEKVAIKAYLEEHRENSGLNSYSSVLEVAARNVKVVEIPPDADLQDLLKKRFQAVMLTADPNVHQKHFEMLERILDQDALTPMDEQDKERVWRLRYECWERYPHALAKLLNSTQWNNHEHVAQMQALLQSWKSLEPRDALELLDFSYADKNVRQFAIRCLQTISDNELQMYLLQLVQVIKYEAYLECELVEFLLERALNNNMIGHNFFWLLRSEMETEHSVAVRFGLMLEAYCRGIVEHLRPLIREVTVLDRFYSLAVRAKNIATHKEATNLCKEWIGNEKNVTEFEQFTNPLDPSLHVRKIIAKNTKVMSSKMRPLWLEFENSDPTGERIIFMFKRGDDLRQDMLTLQILRVIDQIWREDGLDLRLTTYGCAATKNKEGLIEVVTKAKTITWIHNKDQNARFAPSAFNRKALYDWLKSQPENDTPKKLEKAMDEFMYSLAGYSVATYVLGVGDRHGDNIMLKTNGQLCHIDFGHIMGNFKKKYGVNREPAPFLLTPNFVYLVRHGPANNQKRFDEFKELCLKAYITLRKQQKTLITLFLMMVNTGIPELSSLDKITKHLHSTLVPNKTEEEAKQHFEEKFTRSLSKATLMNFHAQIHNIKHKS